MNSSSIHLQILTKDIKQEEENSNKGILSQLF